MKRSQSSRVGNVRSLTKLMASASPPSSDGLQHKRKMVAELCRLLGSQYSKSDYVGPAAECSPRVRQTLGRLLAGDSEKQIAIHLSVSPHTVHVYVKQLYRHYNVCSRGELLAKFVTRGWESGA
jgi:DNA-binding CsgD family transcriptional regulator